MEKKLLLVLLSYVGLFLLAAGVGSGLKSWDAGMAIFGLGMMFLSFVWYTLS